MRLIRWIKRCAAALLILNLLDLLATLLLVLPNLTTELNPFMATALAMDPVAFAIVKMVLVALSTWLLAYRVSIKYPIVTLLVLAGLIGLYGLVCMGHLHALVTVMTATAQLWQ